MKKSIILSSLVSTLYLTPATASDSVSISKVIVGPQAADSKSEFSLKIKLQTGKQTFKRWQLGFYMPRTFRSFNRTNRNLKMQICDTNSNKCTNLRYLKAPFTQPDLSTVFTTIVGPVTDFPLLAAHNYQINILHNSSGVPQNYSALPQSFFLVSNGQVFNLATSPASYQSTKQDANSQEQINKHVAANWANSNSQASPLTVIPAPAQVVYPEKPTSFSFGPAITLYDLSNNSQQQRQLWLDALTNDLNLPVKALTSPPPSTLNSAIILRQVNDPQLANPEAYRIKISAQSIVVEATSTSGIFYALQTLRQLWFNHPDLDAMTITDQPRFKYRGMFLDVARHYFTVQEIKNFLEIMASLKLNTLHLHLSDDEAFRLQLESYPQLTQIGAFRGYGEMIGPKAMIQTNLSQANTQLATPGQRYGGYYTPADIRSLINYANLRQITIIPEIDIPGHSRALMKALPNSFHEAEDKSTFSGYGDNSIPVCAYDSATPFGKRFTHDLTNILNQVAQLFSDQTTLYAINNELSIGGDEVTSSTWEKSPACQQLPWRTMDALAKEHYFLDMLNNDAVINQLHLSGWHDFVMTRDGTINPNHRILPHETGHVWAWGDSKQAKPKAITLSNAGYPTVISYSDYLYFDMTYTTQFTEPGLYWATHWSDTYASLASATAASSTIAQSQHGDQILGIEGSLWTDVIADYHHLQYMALPKMTGLAEASWAPAHLTANGNWQSLAQRLGCGINGYLAFAHVNFKANYRGYPNGIKLEAPKLCP